MVLDSTSHSLAVVAVLAGNITTVLRCVDAEILTESVCGDFLVSHVDWRNIYYERGLWPTLSRPEHRGLVTDNGRACVISYVNFAVGCITCTTAVPDILV